MKDLSAHNVADLNAFADLVELRIESSGLTRSVPTVKVATPCMEFTYGCSIAVPAEIEHDRGYSSRKDFVKTTCQLLAMTILSM